MARKPRIIAQYKDRQNLGREDLPDRRWNRPLSYARFMAEDTARRVAESRKLFGRKFYRGDCHSHTQHSDGIGTVQETAEMVKAAGLDFQFVTDHWGVTQAPECRKHGLWVGQEPPTQHHHLGILGLDHAFEPAMNLVDDVREARARGAVIFIPHPAGWFPAKVYTDQQKQSLYDLPAPFLMEVINGANNVVTAFDYTDQMAVDLWDELLLSGRQIHAMANTDAHSPHAIGIAWNGVMAPRLDQASILKALSAGRSFASEGPLLDLTAGRVKMGGRIRNRETAEPLQIKVVDSRGLLQVRLIGDGKVRRTWHPAGEPILEHQQAIPRSIKRYVRVEAISTDGRRGFSNPIYL